MSDHRWYAAVLVVRSSVEGAPEVEPLFDIQYRMIQAPDAESAYQKAFLLGERENQSYPNADGENVVWTFVGLRNLQEIADPIADGVEVYSELYRGFDDLTVPKEQLAAFRFEVNRDRSVDDILGEMDGSV